MRARSCFAIRIAEWRTPQTELRSSLMRPASPVPRSEGQIGNASRNMIRRPGVINFDLAFFKNIRFGEKVGLQFRWETYNLFNHTNFDDINTDLTFARDAASEPDRADQSAFWPAELRSLAARDAGVAANQLLERVYSAARVRSGCASRSTACSRARRC